MKGNINFIPIYRFLLFLFLFVFVAYAGLTLIHSCGTVSYYTEISDMCSNTRLGNSLYFMSDIEDVIYNPDYSVLDILEEIENFECVDTVFATKKVDVNSNNNYTIYIYSSELLELFSQQRISSSFSSDGLSAQGQIQGIGAMHTKEFSPAYFIESGEQIPIEQIGILKQGTFYPRFIINSNQIKFFDLLYTNENALIVKETPEVMSLLEGATVLYDTNLLIVLNDEIDFNTPSHLELRNYLERRGTYVTFDFMAKESSDFQNIKLRENVSALFFGILTALLSIVIIVFFLKQLHVSDRQLKTGVMAVLLIAFCFNTVVAALYKLFYVLPMEHFSLHHNIYFYLILLYGGFLAMAMISISRRYTDDKTIQ